MTFTPWVTLAVLVAIVASLAAYLVARRALRIAGEQSRGAGVTASVADGEARRTLADDRREYALLLALTNRSSEPISVSAVSLRVTYRTRANFLGAVDVVPDMGVPSHGGRTMLRLPAVVAPGADTVAWLMFRTVNVIPRHCRIDDHTLILEYGAARRLMVDASLPQVRAADSDGVGPATWGWD